MKTGLTPAESMVVNGGERSNAATQGTSAPQAPHFFELETANAIFSGWV